MQFSVIDSMNKLTPDNFIVARKLFHLLSEKKREKKKPPLHTNIECASYIYSLLCVTLPHQIILLTHLATLGVMRVLKMVSKAKGGVTNYK